MPALGRFLALLRGINVGGNNLISKDELRQCFESLGFDGVRTYIQSGNVVFQSATSRRQELTDQIEAELARRFDYDARVVVLSKAGYARAMRAVPEGWGEDDTCRHDALFVLPGTTAARILAQLPEPHAEIETVTAGPGVIFWSVKKEARTRATLNRLSRSPVYKQVTVRNHNTAWKLLELLTT